MPTLSFVSRILAMALLLCHCLISYGQTIEVLNIPTTYGNRSKKFEGFSLEGDRLQYGRSKLLETANFGPGGTVPQTLDISSGFEDYNSITSVASLNAYDIIFIGSVFDGTGSFSQEEIEILKAWSSQEKKVMIIAEQPLAHPISAAFGFPESDGNLDPSTPTDADADRDIHIFSGPFGNVAEIRQLGTSQGYFTTVCTSPALARNANGDATIIYDTTHNDVFISDTGFFQNEQMQNNTAITNASETAWVNLWAWAVREVLTGTLPISTNIDPKTQLLSSSPACPSNEARVLAFDHNGDILFWETSTDDGITWVPINESNNPLIYPNPADSQKFRAITSISPSCPAIISTETTVHIAAPPQAGQPPNMVLCDTSGSSFFYLREQDAAILGGLPGEGHTVRYFIDAARTSEITGLDLTQFNNTANPQEIYASLMDTTTLCEDRSVSFQLIVDSPPDIGQPEDLYSCENEIASNKATFDLHSQNTIVLNGQDPSSFLVSYHSSLPDAQEKMDLLQPMFTNIENPQTVYVRVESEQFPNCHSITSFDLHVTSIPVLALADQQPLCPNGTRELVADPGYDEYSWSTGATSQSITVDSLGIYEVTVTNFSGQERCSATKAIEVTEPSNTSIGIETLDWMQQNNKITIIADGPGAYEYSLDGITYQASPVFTNLEHHEYTVHIRDTAGCEVWVEQVCLLDYPRVFTPNGDGYNDRWQLTNAHKEPNAKISIFDRYGKFLKSVSPTEQGWDGTYNGRMLPSSDYWFLVEREDGRIHRGHFSLKR